MLDDPEVKCNLIEQKVNYDTMIQDLQKFEADDSVRRILEEGEDLTKYKEDTEKKFIDAENEYIKIFSAQMESITKIRDEMLLCDKNLEDIEVTLINFGEAMNTILSNISMLKTNSEDIQVKLTNRRALDEYLGVFTNNVTVTKEFTDIISNMDITEKFDEYVKYIKILGEKLEFTSRKDLEDMPAIVEILPKLYQLRQRASSRIKKKMESIILENAETNDDMLFMKQKQLLSFKPLFQFLKTFSSDDANDILGMYVYNMSKRFYDKFNHMLKTTSKLMTQSSFSSETLVPATQKFFFKKSTSESSYFFTLGTREEVLNNIKAPPEVFEKSSYPIETLLRSMYQHIISCVSVETVVVISLFDDEQVVKDVFSKTLHAFSTFMNSTISKITDPVCIALLLKINIVQTEELNRYQCQYTLSEHFDFVYTKLAKRFEEIVDENINAIDQSDVKSQCESTHASAMTKRFCELINSLSIITFIPEASQTERQNDRGGVESKLIEFKKNTEENIRDISVSIIKHLEKCPKYLQPEDACIFFINNYFMIVSTSIDYESIIEIFQQQYSKYADDYIKLQLTLNFKRLIDIIDSSFTSLETQETPKVAVSVNELREIATDFKNNYQQRLENLIQLQIRRFNDFNNSKELATSLAKRLVLYWAKFHQVCNTAVKGTFPQWMSTMIQPNQIAFTVQPLIEELF